MGGKKKEYLLFTSEFPPQKGGVSKYYENLLRHWPENTLKVLTDGHAQEGESDDIIRRRLFSGWIRPRWLPSLLPLYKHAPGRHVIVGQILPLGLPTHWLSRRLGFEYSVVLHGLDLSLSLNRPKDTKRILSDAKAIICANGYTASKVRSFDSSLSNKISIVNPGIDPNFIRNPAKVKELKDRYGLNGKKVIFGMARLVERKGFDKAIQAMTKISTAVDDAFLVIGGRGPDENRLKGLADELPENIKSKMIFTGFIENDEYWAWLELCDIFIMTSRDIAGDYEGFGIVYLEANLAGKPVIAGDSGGVRDAVLDNVTGLLVNPEDVDSIADAAIDLLRDERLRSELGAAGNRRVVETMSAKKQAEKFHRALLNIKL